jgi:hypothetical protein
MSKFGICGSLSEAAELNLTSHFKLLDPLLRRPVHAGKPFDNDAT